MNGPTMNNRMEDDPPPPEIQSNDVLARDAVTDAASVKHILISWKDQAGAFGGVDKMDPRAANRSRAEADRIATDLLARVRAGEPIEPLMEEFSEDPGSASTASSYEVKADSQYVFEFKRMGLRLNVGESGLVMSEFGWHIMKRTE